MKVVILAGGLGSRLSEETHSRPKPMIEIGNKPILWHIMKIYSSYNINEFIICCGYKGYLIKEYFSNYLLHQSDVTFHLDEDNRVEIHESNNEPWKVTLVDTGESTQTAGRLGRVKKYIGDEPFCFTYGDGLSTVNIGDLIKCHSNSSRVATMTTVMPPGRFGNLSLNGNSIDKFVEKPLGDNNWINGGFFVLEAQVLERIYYDSQIWEKDILPVLAEEKQLNAYKHTGFWHPMDTLRDFNNLNEMWKNNQAPWKIW